MTLEDWIKIAPLLSAGVAAITASVALLVFVYTRRTNRRRATLDMVMRTFLDEEGRKRYSEFKGIIRRHQDITSPFSIVEFADHPEPHGIDRSLFLHQMNNYELVALGIRRGMFDEQFYKLWFHRQFTTDYESVHPFVEVVQRATPTRYYEFRSLYQRWEKNRHPVAQPSRRRLIWWILTKNFEKLDEARTAMKSANHGKADANGARQPQSAHD